MKCRACGKKNAPRSRFCSKCGKPLAQQRAQKKSKGMPPAPLFHNQYVLMGGILLGVIIIIVLLLFILPSGDKGKTGAGTSTGTPPYQAAKHAEEIGPNAVYGKVLSVQRGVITVRSLNTRKAYTFYVGRRTNYTPRRYPVVGEKVKVIYIDDQGQLKATWVEIHM